MLHRDRKQFPYDAWDIGADYLKRTPRTLTPSEVESRIDGPTVVRRQVYRFGRSRIEQLVRLEAGSELVRFETRVEWHESHRMLRADFRPAHFGETVACEIQFGHLERTTIGARRRGAGAVRGVRPQVGRDGGSRTAASPCSTTASTATGPRAGC